MTFPGCYCHHRQPTAWLVPLVGPLQTFWTLLGLDAGTPLHGRYLDRKSTHEYRQLWSSVWAVLCQWLVESLDQPEQVLVRFVIWVWTPCESAPTLSCTGLDLPTYRCCLSSGSREDEPVPILLQRQNPNPDKDHTEVPLNPAQSLAVSQDMEDNIIIVINLALCW